MKSLIRSTRIWLWGVVAELEYQLYPWKGAREIHEHEEYNPQPLGESTFSDDWLKSQEERISRLQEEMIYVQREIHNIQSKL